MFRSAVHLFLVLICARAGYGNEGSLARTPGTAESSDQAESPEGERIESLIAALQKLPPDRYFDRHGNEHEKIRAVLTRRFDATEAVCGELDRAGPQGSPEYIGILYYCLGYVKDPALIPWLEKRLKQGDTSVIYDEWLGHWQTYPRVAGHRQLKWLDQPDRWAGFFRRWISSERDGARRLALLKALAGWFHDAQTIQFYVELEKAQETEGETLLLTQLYLKQHKQAFRAALIPSAIEKLKSRPGGKKILLEYADELRHEAFLPWLISVTAETPEEESGNPQWILEEITFRRDVVGREAWLAWYRKNGSLGKQAWLRLAMAQFEALAEKDPRGALAFFDRAVYRWDDRELLPYVRRWLNYRFLHSLMIGWINLSYHPFWRDDLRPIAETILRENSDRLEPWAQRIAKALDFIENDETWEDQFHWYRM